MAQYGPRKHEASSRGVAEKKREGYRVFEYCHRFGYAEGGSIFLHCAFLYASTFYHMEGNRRLGKEVPGIHTPGTD